MKFQMPGFKHRWQRLLQSPGLALWLGVAAPLLVLMAGVLLLTTPVTAAGPTPVGGPITTPTTWTKDNSPYIVTSDVTVDSGGVLTIEPGVQVRFDASTELRVTAGRLMAIGTAAEPITFTANTASPVRTYWVGIEFEATSQANSVIYCLVEYAGTGIYSDGSSGHLIDHCTLRHNGDSPGQTSGGAINSEADSMTITNNEIYENELGVLLYKSLGDRVQGNSIYLNDNFGIGLINHAGSGGDDNQISDNQIYDNGGDGLALDDGNNNQVLRNKITNNEGHGVSVERQTGLQMIGNIVRNNAQYGLFYAASNYSAPTAIHSNVLCGNALDDLRSLWSASITAEGNWFGAQVPGSDQISGQVDYTPWIAMNIAANPDHRPPDGTSTADLTLTMVDGAGHSVPDGYTVDLSPSQGSLLPSSLSLASGQAHATYTAGTVAGDVGFQATDACTTLSFPAVLVLEPCLDLAVSKGDGDGMVSAPWPDKTYLVTYTVAYNNSACTGVSGVVLTDNLPPGTQFHSGDGWSCTGGTCTYDVGSLPANSAQAATPLVVRVMTDALTGCPALVNQVSIADDGTKGSDVDPGNNTFSTNTDLPCQPDLVLTKAAVPVGCVEAGDRITYTLAYTNVGLADASGVTLNETVPAHTVYVGSGWTCAGSSCQRSVGNVPKGASSSVPFVVQVADSAFEGAINNTAQIGSTEADIDPRDNQSQVTNPGCLAEVDLQVSKIGGELIVAPNKDYVVEYTIAVTNTGDLAASGVVITDLLPDAASYDGSGWTCAGGECTYTVGDLAPSAAQQVLLRLKLDKAALHCPVALTNTVEVTDDGTHGPERSPADNTFALVTTLECLPDLIVALNANSQAPLAEGASWARAANLTPAAGELNGCVQIGERITYTIDYANAGLATATQAVLTETIPAHTRYVGQGWACVGSTCTRNLGNLAPGTADTAEFVVRVDAAPPDLRVKNEVQIGAAEADLYPPDNKSSIETVICEPPPLLIKKSDNLPCAFPGDEIRYTITFTNPTNAELSGVVLTETLPAHTAYQASAEWVSLGGDQFSHEHGTLAPYTAASVEFVVTVDDPLPEPVTTTVNLVCFGYDGLSGGDNCVSMVTRLPLLADLRVVKHDWVDLPSAGTVRELDRFSQVLYDRAYRPPALNATAAPIQPGDLLSYTITYLNAGRKPTTGTVLTETLPANTSYVGYDWTQVDGTTYGHPVGTLGIKEGGTIAFWVKAVDLPRCGSDDYLSNWVQIGGDAPECNLDNNRSGEQTPFEWQSCIYDLYTPLVLKGYPPSPPPTPPPPTPPPPTPPPSGDFVADVAVNPETNRVYIASPELDSVLAVDPTGDGAVVATIPVGKDPNGLAVVPTLNKIYAANFKSGTVTAIRGSDHTPIVDRVVGAQPSKMAADPADGRVYVANHGELDNGAAAINSQTDEFVYYYTRLHAVQGRYGIDVDPKADKLFIAGRDAGAIAIQNAYQPALDPLVFKLSPARVPYVLAFNPATGHLFVTAADDDKVVVLDPYNIQWNQGAWVAWQGQRVLLLDPSNAGWIKEIDVGSGAEEGIAINPDTGTVYVSNGDSDTLSVIQDSSILAQIQWVQDIVVGDHPVGVDVDLKTNTIYVGNAGSRDLTVINGATHTVVKTIPLD